MAKEHSTRGVDNMVELDLEVGGLVKQATVQRLPEYPRAVQSPSAEEFTKAREAVEVERAKLKGTTLLHKLFVEHDSATRKMAPLATGCLGYFPRALMAVALHSYLSNEKHNPGQPLHWSFDKSNDHADCEARHLVDSLLDNADATGMPHSVAKAWRALADCEKEIMELFALPLPPSAK